MPAAELLKCSLLQAMTTSISTRKSDSNWGQPENHGVRRSGVKLLLCVRSMTAPAISMEFNQQQPAAQNSHNPHPHHIYPLPIQTTIPSTHPPTKLSVSQSLIQSVSQLRCSAILQNSTCENCASNANGNGNRQRILFYIAKSGKEFVPQIRLLNVRDYGEIWSEQ